MLSFGFLDDPHDRVQDNNDHDGRGVNDLTQKQGDDGGDNQDDDQEVVELGEEELEKAGPGLFNEFVRPILLEPLLSLCRG